MARAGQRPRGITVRAAHYPDRVPIDAYGNGGFRFAEMSHRGSILCVPSGIYGWAPDAPDEFGPAAFERVFAEADGIDFLLVGTGAAFAPLEEALAWELRGRGVRFETMSTGAAVRTYNVLVSEGRRVAAALLKVD